MKLFYSGAKTLNDAQYTPEKSLGGFISSTVIPNGKVESVFSSFSNLSLQSNETETKGIFLKNTFSTTKKNILVYCVYPKEPHVKVDLAAVVGNELEYLRSSEDIPYYADFYNVEVKYSSSLIKVIGAFYASESVVIEDVLVPVPNGTKEEFLTNCVLAFRDNLMYEAIRTEDDEIKLQYRNIGVFTNNPVITTFNENTLSWTPFGGGIDNSKLIAKELKPGESIGLWLRRTPLEGMSEHRLPYYKDLYDKFVAADYGVIQQQNIENISFCIEFT